MLFPAVVVNILAVAIDGFAGIDFVPSGAAIEACLEGKAEVVAGGFNSKSKLEACAWTRISSLTVVSVPPVYSRRWCSAWCR